MLKNRLLNNKKEFYASLILRIGLAIVFFYAAISSLINPDSWIGFTPSFIKNIISENIFLNMHSIGNIFMGLWFLSNKGNKFSGIFAAIIFFGILIFNLNSLDILFRDIGLIFMAMAFSVLNWNK